MKTSDLTTQATLSDMDLRLVMNGLLTTLSHDLRTPLSVMSGWLYLIDSDRLDAAAKTRALEKIRASVDSQVLLIDDISLFSRALTGHLPLDLALVSPLVSLEAAIDAVRGDAAAGTVALSPVQVSEQSNVMADELYLRRVMTILLQHALKTTPPNGAIESALCLRDGWVEIIISDNGIGVDALSLPYLFNAFSRVDGTSDSAYPGAERSLMLARVLVELHGGYLAASSLGVGQGTTFSLRLREAAAMA